MNKVFGVLSLLAVASVSAVPLVFNKELLGGHGHLVKVLHGAHVPATGDKLRFLFLVPKLGVGFGDGFKTGANGDKALAFLNVPAGHHLLGLLGFSDCVNWHGGLLTVWDGSALVEKPFAFAKAAGATAFAADAAVTGLDGLVTFLKGKMVKAAFDAVWPWLPAHPVVFHLHAKLV